VTEQAETKTTTEDHSGHEHSPGEHHHAVTAVLEELAPCKRLLKISLPADEIKKEIRDQLAEVRRTVRLKGFRQGKVPPALIQKLYGEAVKDEVRKHLLEHSYSVALKDRGVDPATILGEARVENMKFSETEGMAYEVTLQIRPAFELPEYKGLEIKAPKLDVADDEVERSIDGFRRARGEIRPVPDAEAVVEAEDFLSCDVEIWLADEWEAKADESDEKPAGEAGAESKSLKPLKELKDQEVHGPTNRIGELEVEDLADSLVGLKVGEWGEAEATLPADYEVVEGRGEAALVRLKVNAVKRLFLPPLTEEWVKEAGYDSVEDLKREAREDLFRRKELARQGEIEEKVLNALLEKTGAFALPSDLVEAEIKDTERRREYELRMEGKSEDEAKRLILDQEGDIKTQVELTLRYFFLLDEIAKREKIRIADADVDARISRIAQSSGRSLAEIRKLFEERKVLPQIRHELLNEKTRAFLREHAKVVDHTD
jgi:trigger factor